MVPGQKAVPDLELTCLLPNVSSFKTQIKTFTRSVQSKASSWKQEKQNNVSGPK